VIGSDSLNEDPRSDGKKHERYRRLELGEQRDCPSQEVVMEMEGVVVPEHGEGVDPVKHEYHKSAQAVRQKISGTQNGRFSYVPLLDAPSSDEKAPVTTDLLG
jgi:hypothetical protein